MDSLLRDIRYSARLLLKQPGFTALAVLCLALGIGANAAIFSVVNGVLLRPLPFPHSDRLVAVGAWQKGDPESDINALSGADFIDMRERAKAVDLAVDYGTSFNYRASELPERIRAHAVSSNFFRVLGVNPSSGRGFLPDEEQTHTPRSVVLSHAFCEQELGAPRDAVGKTIRLDGADYSIVGVMPAGFRFPLDGEAAALFVPVPLPRDSTTEGNRGSHYMGGVGRLAAGATVAQARAELRGIAKSLEEQYPVTNAKMSVNAISLRQDVTGEARPALGVLAGAVCFLLLIACANVANLMLSRATMRSREVAVRTALGASRSRIVSQLLTESVMVALLGGTLGILLATWGKDWLLSRSPMALPRIDEITMDWRVLIFTIVVSVATGILFGLTPALQTTRMDTHETLKESSRSTSASRSSKKLRSALVVSEIALSLMLLTGAGLLSKSLLRLQGVDPGFDSKDVFVARISLPDNTYKTNLQQADVFARLSERLRALPGVQRVGGVSVLPLSRSNIVLGLNLEGETPPLPGAFLHSSGFDAITPDYLQTMAIPLKSGRYFTEHDDSASAPVAIVSEEFARRFFPNGSALGAHIQVSFADNPPMREIVGIAGDVHRLALDAAPEPEVYTPERQTTMSSLNITVRTSGASTGFAERVKHEVAAIDPDLAAGRVRRMDVVIEEWLAPRRFSALVLGIFGLVALALSAVGVFGVMMSIVTQRTREFALRVALGAQPRDVVSLVMSHGMTLAGLGTVIGIAGAVAVSRLIQGLLYGVGATDAITLAGAALVLGSVALLACWIPARRATRADPVAVLKDE